METMTNGGTDGANSGGLQQRLDQICQDFIESRAGMLFDGVCQVYLVYWLRHRGRRG